MNSYQAAKYLRRSLMRMPLGVVYFLGSLIGFVIYLSPGRRRIALRNIKSALTAVPNPVLRRIIRQSFINLGYTIVESMIAPRLWQHVKIMGLENIRPQGGIIVAIHEGSWELLNSAIAQKTNYAILAKEQKEKNIDLFLNEMRNKYKLKVCFSLKEIIRSLQQSYLVGMTIDHGAEDNAIFLDFFSHTIPTPRGAVYLAQKLNKPIYPCFGRREKGYGHTIEIGKPILTQDLSQEEILSRLNKIFEDYLYRYPQEYLWHYKRFKKKKNLEIVILNDGKAGHLKQSKSLVNFISQTHRLIHTKIIDIAYINKHLRILADICALFTGKNCINCGRCLRFLLDERMYRTLSKVYADVVVSTGSYAASLNRILSSTLGAKSVTILRPNIPLRKFDLCLIPEHDRINSAYCRTIKGAVSYPDNTEEKLRLCRDRFKLKTGKRISFFLGGPIVDEKEFMANLRLFLPQLKEFARAESYKLLVSTSRRTPPEAEEYVKSELEKFELCQALVCPRLKNYDFAFDAFILMSDITFISSESISMLSEAMSLAATCVAAVHLEKQGNKHDIFLDLMADDLASVKKPYTLDKIRMKKSSLFEYNKNAVTNAIKELL